MIKSTSIESIKYLVLVVFSRLSFLKAWLPSAATLAHIANAKVTDVHIIIMTIGSQSEPMGFEFKLKSITASAVSRIACEPKFLKKFRKCSRPSSSKYTLFFLSSAIVMLSIDF